MDVVTSVVFGHAPTINEFDLLAVEVAKLAVRIEALEPKPIPAPLPVIDVFTATPDSAEVGQPVVLKWVTGNAITVALGAMPVDPHGSYQLNVAPGPNNDNWTLYATNADGVTVTKTATITILVVDPPPLPPPPVIEYFTAAPISGIAGSVSRLAWKVTGAVDVQLGAMDVASEGTHDAIVSPFASGNVWVLQARNDGLSVTQELSVVLITDQVPPPADTLPPLAPVYDVPAQPFRVGMERYATLQSALDALTDGDTLHIMAGKYFGQGGTLLTPNVLIICDDGEAVFQVTTIRDMAGLIIAASGTICENIAWEDMACLSGNGAGIRWQKAGGANLTLRACRFSYCENGILSDNDMPEGTLLIDGCRFDHCGRSGQEHGAYIGSGRTTLVVQNSRFEFARGGGHLLKTRTLKTIVHGSLFYEGGASRALDICLGGDLEITGCSIWQSQETDNSDLIGYGPETGRVAGNVVFRGNYVLDTRSPKGTLWHEYVAPTTKDWEAPGIADAYPFLPPAPVGTAVLVNKPTGAEWLDAQPRNTWLEIADTRLDVAGVALLPSGYQEFGNSGTWNGLTAAWSSMAFDRTRGMIYVMGGGHWDTNNNGWYAFNLATFGWSALIQASIYTGEQINAAKAAWAAAGYAFVGFSQPPTPGTKEAPVSYVWHDGKPTSDHTYSDVRYCEAMGEIVRGGSDHPSLLHVNAATGEFAYSADKTIGTPNVRMLIDGSRVIRMGLSQDTWQVYDAAARKLVMSKTINASTWGGGTPVMIGREAVTYAKGVNSRHVRRLNVDTWMPTSAAMAKPFPLGVWPASAPAWVPKWRKLAYLMNDGSIGTVDPVTCEAAIVPMQGVPPPARTRVNGVYGRFDYWPAKDCFVHVPEATQNVRIIRL